jgi:hypothetical protein
VRFAVESSGSRHPERIALLARNLSWLTPLAVLGVDEQRVLGLVNAAGRPVHAADLEEGAEGDEPPAADAQAPESAQHVAA